MKAPALLALVTLLVYLPSFGGAFQFDDYNVIVNYPTVHEWSALLERAGAGVRPLLKASFTLNWSLDTGTFGFHLVNIALHLLNAVLIFFIGKKITERWLPGSGTALAAALLFALHPAQTEAVTYISGRSVSLMASFYLGALLVYLRGAHWSGSLVLFVLALATRETAVTLPAALLLCEIATADRRPDWKAVIRRQAPHWVALAAAVFAFLLNDRYYELLTYGFSRRTLTENLLTQVGGISYLLLRLVGLHGYNIDPGLPTLSAWTTVVILQAVMLGALLAFAIASLRVRPWIAFGVFWFFLQLAPTNSIVPRLDVANDRQLYLACWGLFLAASVQLARMRVPRKFAVGLGAAVLALFAASNVARQLDYRDEITLWEASVRESPSNARARNNLGYAYYLDGRKSDARREIETALKLDPSYHKARANLLLLDWKN